MARRRGIPNWRKPYLRDVATLCLAVLNVPGEALVCELPSGHEGKHECGCTRWGRPQTPPGES